MSKREFLQEVQELQDREWERYMEWHFEHCSEDGSLPENVEYPQ
jgi:hypothetical protein